MTAAHWIYLVGVVAIIAMLVARKNIVIPAIAATFATVLAFTGSLTSALASVFNGTVVAGMSLFEVFIVVAFIRGLYLALQEAGSLGAMAAPFVAMMRTRATTFWVLAFAVGLFSLLFWATPTAALVGAVLVPVALRVGVPAKSVGAVMLIAGGVGTSDYILRALPGFASAASGVSADAIAERAMVIVLFIALPGLVMLQLLERRRTRELAVSTVGAARARGLTATHAGGDSPAGTPAGPASVPPVEDDPDESDAVASTRRSRMIGILIPVAFVLLAIYMVLPRFTDLVPDSATKGTALVSGLALVLLVVATIVKSRENWLERSADRFAEGITFSFKAMGPVLPIAGFFLLGNGDYSPQIVGDEDAPGFFLDMIDQASGVIPHNEFVAAFAVVLIGLIAGLDGSAIANIPLVASIAASLAAVTGADPVTMVALAQISCVWSGGGMLVPWSSYVLAVSAIVDESPIDLVRRVLLPTSVAFVIGTSAAVILF